jgi:hypothetical protein
MGGVTERLSVYALAAVVLFAILALSYGAGWFVYQILF